MHNKVLNEILPWRGRAPFVFMLPRVLLHKIGFTNEPFQQPERLRALFFVLPIGETPIPAI